MRQYLVLMFMLEIIRNAQTDLVNKKCPFSPIHVRTTAIQLIPYYIPVYPSECGTLSRLNLDFGSYWQVLAIFFNLKKLAVKGKKVLI